jgi:hypothetical protein
VCTLAVKKKKSGQVLTCRIGPFPCESAGPKSTPPHASPVVAVGDIEIRQEDWQQYNLRSWLTKDADSTNKKGKDNKARVNLHRDPTVWRVYLR